AFRRQKPPPARPCETVHQDASTQALVGRPVRWTPPSFRKYASQQPAHHFLHGFLTSSILLALVAVLTGVQNTAQMSSMAVLTEKQEAVRKFIADELDQGRPCPTRREIAAHFGFASSYAAACHVQALINKRVLIAGDGKARSLR